LLNKPANLVIWQFGDVLNCSRQNHSPQFSTVTKSDIRPLAKLFSAAIFVSSVLTKSIYLLIFPHNLGRSVSKIWTFKKQSMLNLA